MALLRRAINKRLAEHPDFGDKKLSSGASKGVFHGFYFGGRKALSATMQGKAYEDATDVSGLSVEVRYMGTELRGAYYSEDVKVRKRHLKTRDDFCDVAEELDSDGGVKRVNRVEYIARTTKRRMAALAAVATLAVVTLGCGAEQPDVSDHCAEIVTETQGPADYKICLDAVAE